MDKMEQSIMDADMSDSEKSKLLKNLFYIREQKINLMVTGATGCGKSSTINALFKTEVAKVGTGVDPETMEITKYELDNLVIWDTPGLGDGKEADVRHAKNIVSKLNEKDGKGELLIDLVLVILDGSTRDLGTSYELINQVIVPNLGEDKEERILVAINQADVAMKSRERYWDEELNRPKPQLEKFLEEKVISVQKRIKEGTGIDITPIYYSAGFKEEGMEQSNPYNLSKLLYYIIKFTPKKKRFIYMDNINSDEDAWKDNDKQENYQSSVKDLLIDIGTDIELFVDDVKNKVEEFFDAINPFNSCYITTATCEAYGKPDDCYELTMFRKFRDGWLQNQSDGKELIARYYATAPAIVELINKQPERMSIYNDMNERYLSKCLSYIESGENEKCKETYIEMMEYLYKEQKKWQRNSVAIE
jgi:hypothetical protein